MKKFLVLFLLPFAFSCSSYYPAQLTSATPVYQKQTSPDAFDTIPAGEHIMIRGKKATKYRMIDYKGAKGYAVNPAFKEAVGGKKSSSKKKK